jgi:hypothetical protein
MHIARRLCTIVIGFFIGTVIIVRCDDESGKPYNAPRTERENVFEFTEKPAVKKEGDRWSITFACRGKCDVTVSVVDKNGRIIRHLGSGVLGSNAPLPFQQNSLSQRLEWDGKDDFGRTAPPECKIRVSLGLNFRLAGILGGSPGVIRSEIIGLVCDAGSYLYVLCAGARLRVYDRFGQYVRTLLPPPANITPDNMTLFEWTQTTFGPPAIVRSRGGAGHNSPFKQIGFSDGFARQTPAMTPDGRLVLCTVTDSHKFLLVNSVDGSVPDGALFSPGGKEQGQLLGHETYFMTVSPDGRYLYFSGSRANPARKKPAVHCVSRIDLHRRDRIEKFVGDAMVAGNDDTHFDQPMGISCDKDGNIYVCDYGNDRIQVLKPDGTLLKSIPHQKPYLIAVNPKTGEIYVLSCTASGKSFNGKLMKLGTLTASSSVPPLDLPPVHYTMAYSMALDWASNPSAMWVWIGGQYQSNRGLWRVEERNGKLEKTLDAVKINSPPEGWERWSPYYTHCYIAADPWREELYVREGDQCFPSQAIRVDGRTGKLIERLELRIEQFYPGPDRLMYMRLSDAGQWIARYDPDGRKFKPMTAPDAKPVLSGGYAGNFGGPVNFRGETILGVQALAHGGSRTFQDIFGVAPNGDLYVPCGIKQVHIDLMEKAGLPHPAREAGLNFVALHVFSSEGQLKCVSVLPGLGHSAGLRIGRSGAVYIVLQCHPDGQKVPDGIAPAGKYPPNMWGTLVKFNSRFDQFPVGTIHGRWDGKKPEKPTHWHGSPGGSFHGTGTGQPVVIENVLWQYGGPLINQSGCTCGLGYFDIDGFERVFVPFVPTCTLNVLDSNGNLILRAGGRGNADSLGKDSPVPDPKTGVLRPRRADDPVELKSPLGEPELGFMAPRYAAVTDEAVYVHDQENERIIRAEITYHVEETLPVP